MAQRTIRFPDDLEKAIQAEADRTNRKFHWIVVNHCRTIGTNQEPGATPIVARPAGTEQTINRGSASPSLARFGGKT